MLHFVVIQQNNSKMKGSQSNSWKISNLKRLGQKNDDNSDYIPYSSQCHSKKIKISKKQFKSKRKQNFNKSKWTLQENLLYKDFLKNNLHLFDLERQQRRSIQINVLISNQVKTRTSDQCRSHHQKMLIYHENILKIIEHIQDLQDRQEEDKITQSIQLQKKSKSLKTLNKNMKEIEDVKVASPSLWESIIEDFWNNPS